MPCLDSKKIVVIGRIAIPAALAALLMLTTGCQSLFVSNRNETESPWTNWDQVTVAFNGIAPDHTRINDLKRIGFDPNVTPNIKIMPYVDIVPIFMPNPNIHVGDLPIGVRVYMEAKTNSCAYLVELQDVREKRHGNILLDVFGFKRQTHHSGWQFKGLILIRDDVVVYTLSSGTPDISSEESKVRPLGPFQELDGCGGSIISMCR
jgi:hypothetical protein